MRKISYWGAALLATLAPTLARAETARLTVEDVVRMAGTTEARLKAARAQANAADSRRKSAFGRLLPTLAVSDEYQHWDKPFVINFGQQFQARDQDTNTFVASANQPLIGLIKRSQDYSAAESSAEAAKARVKVSESALRGMIETQYLRLFEARALLEVNAASEKELAQQVSVAEAGFKVGTQTNADVLRVRVALAGVQQQGIAATTQIAVARANLLSIIGYPPDDTATEFVEPTSLLTLAESPNPHATDAVEKRPEIEQARLEAEAARHEAKARKFDLLPEADLEGAYVRTDGQVFAPKDQWYVGVKAQWPLWQWGATYHAQRAAAAQAVAAESEVEAQRRDVLTEVAQRNAELNSATSAVKLAEDTIASATEAYRVTDALVRAGSGTTTDLLNAQAALTQARVQLAQAKYERAIARVQLERALGAR